jgi:hypothetical protein
MRAWILGAVLLSACDGGGGCLIDSDCQDFSLVCIDEACVPAGTVQRDSGAPGFDAGMMMTVDAGRDAGPVVGDAGRDAGTPMCLDATGVYSLAGVLGTCNGAMMGYTLNVAAAAEPCQFTAATAVIGAPSLDGTFTMAADGTLSGTLSVGGGAAEACTGMFVSTDNVYAVTCGACTLTLSPAP